MMKAGDLVRTKSGGDYGVVIGTVHEHTSYASIVVRLINSSFYGKKQWPYNRNSLEVISESR